MIPLSPVDKIFQPESGQIFVFGSNLAGIHKGGAAEYAHKKLGATWGVAEGLLPNEAWPTCYAVPTIGRYHSTLPLEVIRLYVDRFIALSERRTDLSFFVTRIGCGEAGYRDEQIAQLFVLAPLSCELPHGWRK